MPQALFSAQPGGGAVVRPSSNNLVPLPMEKTPMRDTEIVLNSPETDARETPTQGLNEHHDTKQRTRARGRGEHGSACGAPPSDRRASDTRRHRRHDGEFA